VNAARLTIVIPTRDRPTLLPQAVESALAQERVPVEVIVVDDASEEAPALPNDPRLRVERLATHAGGCRARNVGLELARGRWVTFLDDDDTLLPGFATASLDAVERASMPAPIAVLSGLDVVDEAGRTLRTCLPPSLPRGSHFGLEEIDPRLSFFSKQTLVAERAVLRSIGGFDVELEERPQTDLLLRLNPVCSLVGVRTVTYRHLDHQGSRIGLDHRRRQSGFRRLVEKHAGVLASHPKGFATLLFQHASVSLHAGQRRAAAAAALRAVRTAPMHTLALAFSPRRLRAP